MVRVTPAPGNPLNLSGQINSGWPQPMGKNQFLGNSFGTVLALSRTIQKKLNGQKFLIPGSVQKEIIISGKESRLTGRSFMVVADGERQLVYVARWSTEITGDKMPHTEVVFNHLKLYNG